MKCPVCKEPDLLMTERQGVEIDYCPSCRGVWLDRGELDKIVERLHAEAGGGGTEQAPPRDDRSHDRDHGTTSTVTTITRPHETKHKKKTKPTSFIMDVFEGFGG